MGRHLQTLNGKTGAVLYTFVYDTQGRLTSITDAYQNQTQVIRNPAGNPTGILSPYGQLT